MTMIWKLAGHAKWAAKLLMIEMLLPGGTLLVFALLLAGRSAPAMTRRLRALVSSRRWEGRPTHAGDLPACDALRRRA